MTANQIAKAWDKWNGSVAGFVKKLDRDSVEYLSFSKVASVEFCPQRYLLEYVQKVKLSPEPKYFLKGRLLHEAAAKLHQTRMKDKRFSFKQVLKPVEKKLGDEDAKHIRNALTLMHRLVEADWEVVAVEELFVMDLGPELPPCLGVIDLIQRRGEEYAVIDHKGVKRFGSPDRLQLLLYREYARRKFGIERCLAHFDQYRWVSNLDRIRVPAWKRTDLNCRNGSWNAALRRMVSRHNRMRRIEKKREANDTGDCMICPYRDQCSKASFGNRWW